MTKREQEWVTLYRQMRVEDVRLLRLAFIRDRELAVASARHTRANSAVGRERKQTIAFCDERIAFIDALLLEQE